MAEYRTITVAVSLSDAKICTDVRLSESTITVKPGLSAPVKVSDLPAYYGDTAVIPSEQTQVLNTAHTAVLEDITVEPIPGRYKDTSAADFDSGDLLSGKTGYNADGAVVGTMPDNGSVGGVIGTKNGSVTIPEGYTTGGMVSLTNVGDLLPTNLLNGKSVLGVDGGIPVNGATGGVISTKDGSVTIPEGYTTGGTVSLTDTADLEPQNFLRGKTVLGVEGALAPPVATDVSDTTATAEDVLTGKVFFDSSGRRQVGTASGATAVAVVDTEDPAGGTVRSITAIDLTGDTVSPDTLLKGVIAHDAHGNRIVGEYEP